MINQVGARQAISNGLLSRRIYGVDFSGAKDAGKKIWLAAGQLTGDTLRIETCRRADTLPGSARRRDGCLKALCALIEQERAAVFGFDFPFGLPAALVSEGSWETFVLRFPDRYPDETGFRQACREAAAGREWKRRTDVESKTPFSPYNLRLFRQTYFGIRDLLHPLIAAGLASVLPMQRPEAGRAWLLEICPASTLKREGLEMPYKGGQAGRRENRAAILDRLEGAGRVEIGNPELRAQLVDDRGGDALDAVIAAYATGRALRDADRLVIDDPVYGVEGLVYV